MRKETKELFQRQLHFSIRKLSAGVCSLATARAYTQAKETLQKSVTQYAGFKKDFQPASQTQAEIDATTELLNQQVATYSEKKKALTPDANRTIELRILLDQDGIWPHQKPNTASLIPSQMFSIRTIIWQAMFLHWKQLVKKSLS